MTDTATSAPSGIRKRVAAVAALAVLVALGWFVASRGGGDDTPSEDGRAVTSLSVAFPDGWVTQKLKDVDDKAGLLAAGAHTETGTTFLVRTVIGRLAKDIALADLAEQTVAAMTSSIEGFELVDRKVGDVAGAEAITVVYRQASGETVFTTRMIVIPLARQTLYLTARAAGDGLQKADRDVDRLISATVRKVAASN